MANTYHKQYNINKVKEFLNVPVMNYFISVLLTLGYPMLAQDTSTAYQPGDSSRVYIENDTLRIYFEHNKYNLDDSFEIKVKDMANKLLHSYNKILFIHGYTDHTGSNVYNKWLSKKRAETVYKRLLKNKVPSNLIESIEGKGEIPSALPEDQRIPSDRKVMLVLADRNVKQSLSDVNIDSLVAGDEVILQNLNFQPGRHYLLKESIPRLKELLRIMKEHPNLRIELQGHVCCAPNDEDGFDIDTKTKDLSINRAQNIYEYLVRNGIDSSRMTYKGFAKTRPIYPKERNEYEQMMNRRVEIRVLDTGQ
jgi:outer membrane protein OmpA-like peptidoglycan-associated protein